MACYLNENVYTHTFTPREYQVELLDSSKKKNTIVCSSTSSSKAFIVVKLLQEYSWQMRTDNGKKAVLILDEQNIPIMTSHVKYLTDLNVISITKDNVVQIDEIVKLKYHVLITSAEICVDLLVMDLLELNCLNLIVIDDCLYGQRQKLIKNIINQYTNLSDEHKPRILGLTSGLLGTDLQPDRLEAELLRLEKLLNSSVDTSSEIVTLIRLSCRPRERIIKCRRSPPTTLEEQLKEYISDAKQFLIDHRFDPSEIYADEFLEEFRGMPDPKKQPLYFLDTFTNILDDLGPYCADKAAFNILSKIEKLKVKTPYERHYLLLCMLSTTFIRVRSLCDYEFEHLTDKEKIQNFSTQKVLKLIHVLKQFKPNTEKPEVVEKPPEVEITAKGKGKGGRIPRRLYLPKPQNEETLCGLIFVENRYTAKALFGLLCTLSQCDDDFWWISALFSVEKQADPTREPREAETEHKTQEEVLRKFRSHECNIMVATSILEQGCDLPKCNLVIRFDLPTTFHSYIQCKARARANEAHYIIFSNDVQLDEFVEHLAAYNEVENTLLKRCYSLEPDKDVELFADAYAVHCKPYQPINEINSPSVTLTNSIALINRYCAKLPSDTFTRLTPDWHETVLDDGGVICSIRLPINSPVKQTITSPPMPNSLLARRTAAFILCQYLHKTGELDDNLQPIGKENFRASEDITTPSAVDESDDENSEIRPGTTKRRQYYYKRVADSLLNCHPMEDKCLYFYKIDMQLTCPLPEEQNTRGRKIYPPEESPQGFGILTSKEIPKVTQLIFLKYAFIVSFGCR